MVHPWMEGIVSVEEEVVEEKIIAENIETTETIQTQENNKTTIQNISADGSVTIEIETSKPTINEGMLIDIRFSDYNNKQLQEHMNYDIIATQNEEIVLSMIGEHKHDGNAKYTTMELASDDPVEIAITLQGIGIDEIHGPQGETIEFKVVPEFGSIALMILTISIM